MLNFVSWNWPPEQLFLKSELESVEKLTENVLDENDCYEKLCDEKDISSGQISFHDFDHASVIIWNRKALQMEIFC